jgi:hypothetical protein
MGTLHELPEASDSDAAEERGASLAFGFVLFVLWAFSVARVVAAAETHEVFGAEASLAFLCMLALPLGAFRTWITRPRRIERPSTNRRSASVVSFRRRA